MCKRKAKEGKKIRMLEKRKGLNASEKTNTSTKKSGKNESEYNEQTCGKEQQIRERKLEYEEGGKGFKCL